MGEPRRDHSARLGVSIAGSVGPVGPTLERVLARCVETGVTTAEVHIQTLEVVLGAPVPTVPLDPPPADGLAVGLLELEEDVLRDSYDLARRTFDAQVRAWRTTASFAPLVELGRKWRNTGVSIDIVRAPDLILWSAEEVDYTFRAARALGARVVTTRAALAAPRRLAPFAREVGLVLSLEADSTTGASELGRLLGEDDQIAVAIDFDAWTTGGHGSPLPFIRDRARHISHVRLPAHDPMGDPHVRDLFEAVRENQWTFGLFASHTLERRP